MTGVQRNEQEFGFKRTVCTCRDVPTLVRAPSRATSCQATSPA